MRDAEGRGVQDPGAGDVPPCAEAEPQAPVGEAGVRGGEGTGGGGGGVRWFFGSGGGTQEDALGTGFSRPGSFLRCYR